MNDNQKDLISVILPTYNVAPYLVRCLDSILANTYKNLEIIIVDDASPDNSAEIYNKYAARDPRFKIIKHDKNHGVSVARNNGLAYSAGEFIHFFDPDDWVSPNFYEKMHKALVTSNATFAAGSFVKIYPNRKKILTYDKSNVLTSMKEMLDILRLPNVCTCWRNLFRKEFLMDNKISFPEGMKMREDVIFTLDAMRVTESVVTVPDAFYYYFKRPGSAVNSALDDMAKQNVQYARRFSRDFMKEHNYNYYRYAIRLILSRFDRFRY